MRKRAFRAAVTAAVFCVSGLLLACQMGQLRVQIPDYFTSDVKGVQLYRIDDASGGLVDAGRLEFVELETRKDGQTLSYTQTTPEGGVAIGPLYAKVIRDPSTPASIEVTLAVMNQLPAGWFKIASYNLIGMSGASVSQTFLVGAEG